jgi:hypothetical protein
METGIITPWPLYPPEKSPWYPLDTRLGGPQSRSGHGGEENNYHPLPGLEAPIIQSVTQRYTTEMSRLLARPQSDSNIKITSVKNPGHFRTYSHRDIHKRIYPKVSGLVAWSENCKWYSSLPLGTVLSLFYESV